MLFYFANKPAGKILYALIVCTALLIQSCAATDKHNDSSIQDVLKSFKGEGVIPREANKIIVSEFRHTTKQSLISYKLITKLKEQISADRRLAVVTANDTADLLLQGMIIDYQVQPVKYDGFDKPIRKRLRIIASVKLFDIKREKEIFFDRAIQAFDEFSEMLPPITTEIQIQDKVLDELAKRIALKTINGWYTSLMTPVEKGK